MDNKEPETKDRQPVNNVQFESIIQRAIEILGRKLNSEQVQEMAKVFRVLCWDFKDRGLRICLLFNEMGEIRIIPKVHDKPDAIVTLDASTLHDSAYGKTTFGTAFVIGRLKVKGITALKLGKFIPLLKPFLESYREAWETYHG